MSRTRTPILFEAIPSRTPFFGSLCRAKNAFSASPSASGSRSSPATTTPGASGSRASCSSSATPLFETRAAAICDAPTLRPTSRFAPCPPRPPSPGSESDGSESLTWRFQTGGFATAGSCAVSASEETGAAGFDLRENESSRFQKGAPTASFGSFGAFGAFDAPGNERSFFQNGVPAGFASFGAFGSFGLRENESSFFQKGFAGSRSSGGSSAAGTGGCTVTGAGAAGAGGNSASASHGSGAAPAGGSTHCSTTCSCSTTGCSTLAARISGVRPWTGAAGSGTTGAGAGSTGSSSTGCRSATGAGDVSASATGAGGSGAAGSVAAGRGAVGSGIAARTASASSVGCVAVRGSPGTSSVPGATAAAASAISFSTVFWSAGFCLPRPSPISRFQIDSRVCSSSGIGSSGASFALRLSEISFLRNDCFAGTSKSGSASGFDLRLNEISFFRKDCFSPFTSGTSKSGSASGFDLRLSEISFFQIESPMSASCHPQRRRRRLRSGVRVMRRRLCKRALDVEARALEDADELLGAARALQRDVEIDDTAQRQVRKRLFHRLHSARGVRLHHRVDLLDLRLADQVAHRIVRQQDLECGDAPRAVGGGKKRLRDDRLQRAGDHDAHLLLLLGREDVDDAVDRRRRTLRVQRAEHEVARLRSSERGRDRLEVAHLADENHVGVLAERRLQRVRKARRVRTDLALVDDAALVAVHELDRILDGEDVLRAIAIDLVDHRCERRRLTGAGGPGDENETARILRETVQDVREL